MGSAGQGSGVDGPGLERSPAELKGPIWVVAGGVNGVGPGAGCDGGHACRISE
jgi:hypothetical protein